MNKLDGGFLSACMRVSNKVAVDTIVVDVLYRALISDDEVKRLDYGKFDSFALTIISMERYARLIKAHAEDLL